MQGFKLTTQRVGIKVYLKNCYLQVFILGLWPTETKPKLKYTYLNNSSLAIPQMTCKSKPNPVEE